MPNPANAPQILRSILEHFSTSLNGQTFQAVAEKLNQVDGKASWTRRYVVSVANGTMAASQRFAKAIEALAATLDDVPVEIARAEAVEVHAAPGAIQPGAYVMGTSRVCSRPGCGVVFVPNVPWRKFCGVCAR